jgi:hypothetical protein
MLAGEEEEKKMAEAFERGDGEYICLDYIVIRIDG